MTPIPRPSGAGEAGAESRGVRGQRLGKKSPARAGTPPPPQPMRVPSSPFWVLSTLTPGCQQPGLPGECGLQPRCVTRALRVRTGGGTTGKEGGGGAAGGERCPRAAIIRFLASPCAAAGGRAGGGGVGRAAWRDFQVSLSLALFPGQRPCHFPLGVPPAALGTPWCLLGTGAGVVAGAPLPSPPSPPELRPPRASLCGLCGPWRSPSLLPLPALREAPCSSATKPL